MQTFSLKFCLTRWQAVSISSKNANVFLAVELEMWNWKNMATSQRRWKTRTLESVSLWLRNIQHSQSSTNVCFNQTDLDFLVILKTRVMTRDAQFNRKKTKTWKRTPALFSPPLISSSLLLTSSFFSLTFLPHSRQNSSIYKYQQPTLLNCIHTHIINTHQSKPMNTVAYCCQQSQHTLPRPLLPMETGVCVRAHVMLTSYPHTAAALNNKLFQGQIADKNPFFHPTKKDQERGWEKRAG